MRAVLRIPAVALLLTVPTHAQGTNGMTVQDLLMQCEGPEIAAGVQAILALNCSAMRGGYQAPPGLAAGFVPAIGAARQAFINWAPANPQVWGSHRTIGMARAITEAFPYPVSGR